MSAPVPVIRARDEGDKRSFLGGGLHTWKLMAEDTNGGFFVFEDALSRGKSTPLHRHADADETTYILDGEIVVNVDGKERRLDTGALSFVPRGVPHAFLVISEKARLLTIQNPASSQAFYLGASERATGNHSDAVDIARVRASANENGGIELLGPPPFASLATG